MRTIIAHNQKVVIGVDVHTKKHVVTAKVEDKYLKPKHIPATKKTWRNYLELFPECEIMVVYEAGNCGFVLYDWITEIRKEEETDVKCIVAPPADVPKIPSDKNRKTDGRDSQDLIMAPFTSRFTAVVVPDKKKREERRLLRTRESMVKKRTAQKNEICSTARTDGIEFPKGKKWRKGWGQELLANCEANSSTRYLAGALRSMLNLLETLDQEIKALEKQMDELLEEGECSEIAQKLMELPSIGKISALTLATEVADFAAFRNSDAFASYTGLVPGERSSGERVNRKGITRRGNARTRRVLVECAWIWIRLDEEAYARFQKIRSGRDDRKYQAIVAMARRLAVKIYHTALSAISDRAA